MNSPTPFVDAYLKRRPDCPRHPGTKMIRQPDGSWRCELWIGGGVCGEALMPGAENYSPSDSDRDTEPPDVLDVLRQLVVAIKDEVDMDAASVGLGRAMSAAHDAIVQTDEETELRRIMEESGYKPEPTFTLLRRILDGFEPVRDWYNGDREFTDPAHMIALAVVDLQEDRKVILQIQSILARPNGEDDTFRGMSARQKLDAIAKLFRE